MNTTRKTWQEADDLALVYLYSSGFSNRDISVILGRTYDSVSSRLKRLKVSGGIEKLQVELETSAKLLGDLGAEVVEAEVVEAEVVEVESERAVDTLRLILSGPPCTVVMGGGKVQSITYL